MLVHKNGFTLIELLLSTGIISLASIGLYYSYHLASDWRKVNQETKSFLTLVDELENATLSIGNFNGINKSNLKEFSNGFLSSFNLTSIQASNPNQTTLNFNYTDLSNRVCVNFLTQLSDAQTPGALSAKVNNQTIDIKNISDVLNSCQNNERNSLVLSINKLVNHYTIDNIVASINPPEPPHLDVIIPYEPTPAVIPQVPAFVPSTANPIVYGITGVAPVYPIIPPTGGNGSLVLGNDNGNGVTPPSFNPPVLPPAPPATAAPPDDIDQNPLPPTPPPPPPPPPGVIPALPSTPAITVPAGTAPAGQVGGVGELKVNIAWGGSEDVDFALWDPNGVGFGYYAVNKYTGCRGVGCWDLDNKGTINAPADPFNRQENTFYPTNPPLGRYTISLYRFRGRPVNNVRISVTAVIDGKGVNQTIYMPEGFNSFRTRSPYPVKAIIDLHEKYFHLYLM